MGCACSADRKATRPPKAPRNRFWRQPTEQQLASFEASVFGPPPMAFADEADASDRTPDRQHQPYSSGSTSPRRQFETLATFGKRRAGSNGRNARGGAS
mmetsp:Transcript_28584/g.88572  ORF Transcript_28584/g.88572 Transcript_28584/m.88572 type:complete len:99 (+) Transcript_28584:47-343(+)